MSMVMLAAFVHFPSLPVENTPKWKKILRWRRAEARFKKLAMPITDDPDDPDLKITEPNGMQKKYLVLSEEERQKGFVRPYRDSYIHHKPVPKFPLRDLTPEEHEHYDQFGYAKFEAYPEGGSPVVGRFWTKADLEPCGARTIMGRALSETYARDPKFYGATFCCRCAKHFPVEEFLWEADGVVLGS